MKKTVVKVNADDPKSIMKGISNIEGHSSLIIHMNKKELVVIGNSDPIEVVYNLRKFVPAELVTCGLQKEKEEKKKNDEEKEKEEKNKKDEGKVDQKPFINVLSNIMGHQILERSFEGLSRWGSFISVINVR